MSDNDVYLDGVADGERMMRQKLEDRLVKLEKVAMYAQELLHPKGSEPMCLTEQARNENVRRERLSKALNDLNKELGQAGASHELRNDDD
jgi:hypothetical protein